MKEPASHQNSLTIKMLLMREQPALCFKVKLCVLHLTYVITLSSKLQVNIDCLSAVVDLLVCKWENPWIYVFVYFPLTCPSSMSPLWMPPGLSSVLLVRLIDKLWALRFCLGWRAAEAEPLLLPPSTGIPPTSWVALPPVHTLPEKQVNTGWTFWLAGSGFQLSPPVCQWKERKMQV